MTAGRLCQVLGCDGPHYAKGRCRSHYRQWRRGVKAALLLPDERYGEAVLVRSRAPRGRPVGSTAPRRRRGPSGPPYGWGHLPVHTDADGHLPEGSYWDRARVEWGSGARHALPALRDDRLPWYEVGLRVPWVLHVHDNGEAF